jgi:predicted ATPase/DNA-binding CsgD family transcriptional regulator/tetratricopeptide (TPR) repeat protein
MSYPLPAPLTSFIGREPELAELADRLSRARLVTIVGPGGCGKTRLALAVVGPVAGSGEVVWADLASTRDPQATVAEAAGVLHGSPLGPQLAGHRRLLVLDNCEHVLGPVADLVMEVVRFAPAVTVLATSREPLGVAGESVWRLPPLRPDDAVALFADRSGRPPDQAVRLACIRLDGIPLAIELAAAWSGTLSTQEILDGLDDRFALLVRGPRGVAARHQTLAASMAWSHALLDEDDRVLFRRLGVFAGAFTLDAAVAVCEADVRPGLRRLVDKSLLTADTRGPVARYRMLESIRQYALARLESSGEGPSVRARHLAACVALVEAAAPLLDEDKDVWRATIAADYPNLRAALHFGLSHSDGTEGRRLAAGLAWYWHLTEHGLEGLDWLRRAIDGCPDDALRSALLTGLALVADTSRPFGLEYDAAQAATQLTPDAGLPRLLSAVALLHKDFAAAYDVAEVLLPQPGFVGDGARAVMGIVRHFQDDHAAAEPLLTAAIDGLRKRNDRGVGSTALGFLALSALYVGDVARAEGLAREGLAMARPLADYHRVGAAAAALGTVLATAGRYDEGFAVLEPVVRSVAGADAPPFVPGLVRAMGELYLSAGRPEDAIDWFRREAALAPQTQTRLAAALRLTGNDAAAAELCSAALDVARRLGLPRVVAEALEQQAYLTDSVDLHHAALEIRADHGLWLCCLESLEAIGDDVVLAACGRARLAMGLPHSGGVTGSSLTVPEAVEYARRARGKRGRPASGWDSLTPTEQSVVRLAVDGLSNPDIAARLYMSRSTVKTHLSHVYAKLGVTNRTELTRLATPRLSETG